MSVSIPFIAGQWSLRSVAAILDGSPDTFQSPSLRGSGRFSAGPGAEDVGRASVSIPFIAGQWSLPHSPQGGGQRRKSFNPLHCGAVVASRRARRKARRGDRFNPLHCGAVVASPPRRTAGAGKEGRFNPLHCGAVVASKRRGAQRDGGAPRVSIPFIAGQWSLPAWTASPSVRQNEFQSPSLRGSGRFAAPKATRS